jgi:hypothetical protein
VATAGREHLPCVRGRDGDADNAMREWRPRRRHRKRGRDGPDANPPAMAPGRELRPRGKPACGVSNQCGRNQLESLVVLLGQPAPQQPEHHKDRDEPQGDDGRLCAEVVQVSHVLSLGCPDPRGALLGPQSARGFLFPRAPSAERTPKTIPTHKNNHSMHPILACFRHGTTVGVHGNV